MNVLGHDHVPDQRKTLFRAHLAQDLGHHISGPHGRKQGPALIAAKRDEVQVLAPRNASQILGHKTYNPEPTLCKKQKRKG
jgi:hypothetical protein